MTIVYILSPSQSGSTLLSLLLGNQPPLFCAGELDIFAQQAEKASRLPKRRCSCEQIGWQQCAFWSAVDKTLRNQYQLSLATLDVESEDSKIFKSHNQSLFNILQNISGQNIIIDSSKRVERYLRLKEAGFPIVPLRLQRPAAAVVYSWISRGTQWREEDRGHRWWDVAEYYTTFYKMLNKETESKTVLKVDYDDLVQQPESTIADLLNALNIKSDAVDLDWTTQQQHHLNGNPMRYQKKAEIRGDERWKTGLSTSQKWAIAFLTFPTRFDSSFLYLLWKYPIRAFLRLRQLFSKLFANA